MILGAYENGGTRVSLSDDGTKIREVFDPSIPPVLPEQMDLKITDWCDAGCAWCHERSTTRGAHGDIMATLGLLRSLPRGVEIAIGGGDPMSHPEFETFVRCLAGMGLVASVTVNGRHFERHRDTLEKLTQDGALWGVGVSFAGAFPDWRYPHLVHHLIAGVDSPRVLDGQKGLKVLVLGYKEHGRGVGHYRHRQSEVDENRRQWFRELPILGRDHRLSFDNLAITQLRPERLFARREEYRERYMGEEGRYSMYVDAVTQTFAVSSYSGERWPWSDLRGMFAQVRRATSAESGRGASTLGPRRTDEPALSAAVALGGSDGLLRPGELRRSAG